MYNDSKIAVVVPCYNEESQISKVIETTPSWIDFIVIVDDLSQDRTIEVVEKYQGEDSRITLICHGENGGVGAAIASGYRWCRDNKDVDVAVVMAGDAQMDPGDLPNILDPVVSGGTDYSKGNRLVTREAYEMIPKIRYFGNSVLSLLKKIASGYWHVADSQTGYTAIGRKALETIDREKMYKRYGQPNDLLVKLNVAGFRVRDVPIKPVYNQGEQSKMNVRKVIFTISWLLLKLFAWRLKEKYVIRDFHPLVFFYALAFGFGITAMAFFIRLIFLWSVQGIVPEITLLAFLFSAGSGLQSLFFAMWFDMESNKDLR